MSVADVVCTSEMPCNTVYSVSRLQSKAGVQLESTGVVVEATEGDALKAQAATTKNTDQ